MSVGLYKDKINNHVGLLVGTRVRLYGVLWECENINAVPWSAITTGGAACSASLGNKIYFSSLTRLKVYILYHQIYPN